MKEKEEQPENKEQNTEAKEQEKVDIPEVKEIKKRKFWERAVNFFSDKFLKTPIITVFITALLGPVAIQWVNDSIENKKLQKEVIQTVLSYTSEADFSKPESVEKIGIIAKMVDENQGVFGLSFKETTKIIDELNQATNDVGIKNLDKKLKEAEGNIKEMKISISSDSARFNDLSQERDKIVSSIEKYKKRKQFDKVKDRQNKLAKIELDIQEINNNTDFAKKQLKYWYEQKDILEQDIKDATENLSKVLNDKRNKEKILTQKTDQLKSELAKSLTELEMLKENIIKLQDSIVTFKDSIKILKKKK